MKRLEPILNEPLVPASIDRVVRDSADTGDDITGFVFSDDSLENPPYDKSEWDGCLFSHIRFLEPFGNHPMFSNCVFEGCEFDGLRLTKGLFHRCRFSGCRFSGTELADFTILHTLFDHCQLRYATFIDGKMEQTEFTGCEAEKIAFNYTAFKSVRFGETRMPLCEFSGIPLKGINLTSCDVSGIRIRPEDLKGAVFTTVQAIELVRLLGVILKDD